MLNAGRMLLEFNGENSLSIGVIATLKTDFAYERLDGVIITLELGTSIHVDENKGIANYGEDYFSVEPSDYIVKYLN